MNIFSRGGRSRANKPFSANSKNGALELLIYDEISYWGVRAQDVIRAIKNAGDVKEINVRIHSPGGQSFDGVAIHTALRKSGATINVMVEGLAASAASLIAMAGDKIEMASGSMMMIHEAWIVAAGPKAELEGAIKLLEGVNKSYAGIYAKRAGISDEDAADIMAAETWYTAEEAVEAGFADDVADDVAPNSAAFDLAGFGYGNIPDALTDFAEAPRHGALEGLHSALSTPSMTEAIEAMGGPVLDGTTRATAEEPATDKEVTMTDKNKGTGQPGADDVVAAQAAATKAANDRITTFTEIAKEYGIPETLGTLLTSCDTEADAKVRAIELKEIKSACEAAGTPGLFQDAVSNGLSKSSVTSLIAAAKGAKASGEEEVTTHRSGEERPTTAVNKDLDPKTIYERRRKAVAGK